MKVKGSHSDKFIIDSYGWIEYFSDGKLAEKYSKFIENCNPINYFTPSIIVYEVFKKFKANYSEEDAITAIAHIENCTRVIDIDSNYAVLGADTSINNKLPMADALIYGVVSHMNAKLITSDKHFRELESVIFILLLDPYISPFNIESQLVIVKTFPHVITPVRGHPDSGFEGISTSP